jgi:putative methyltransferase (TIGR04325 family)
MTSDKMRSFVKSAVALLPWKLRKLVMFFVEHGLVSRPPFSGVYASFEDMLGTIKVAEDDQAAGAQRNVARGPSRDEATKLPRLRRARSLLPLVAAVLAAKRPTSKPLRILDFGGAAGIDFANLIAAIRDTSNIRYYVVDFPKVCAVGRAKWRDDARISFHDAMPASSEFDLIYGWSSIHYVADPLQLLTQFTTYSPSAILIAGSSFTSGKAFVRAQVNQSAPFPHWVLSLDDVERRMSGCGYCLAYHVTGEDDYNVDNYPPAYRVPNSASLLFLRSP